MASLFRVPRGQVSSGPRVYSPDVQQKGSSKKKGAFSVERQPPPILQPSTKFLMALSSVLCWPALAHIVTSTCKRARKCSLLLSPLEVVLLMEKRIDME